MNVTFVGMSGAGKSYIGQQFADAYGLQFIDIARALEAAYQKPPQVILDSLGETAFLAAEAKQVIELGAIDNAVISPGGSVVYTKDAMDFLELISCVVYLAVPLSVIQSRIREGERGIVGLGTKSFAELYHERQALYEAAADVVIDPTGQDMAHVLSSIHDACVVKYSHY